MKTENYFLNWCVPCSEPTTITKQGYFDCGKLECSAQKHVCGIALKPDEIGLYERNRFKK